MANVHIRRASCLSALFILLFACGLGSEKSDADPPERKPLVEIKDRMALDRIMATAGERLLVIDFYADWCLPCRQLEPILEAVAGKKRDLADFYKISFDDNRSLAEHFGVRGIPFVAFVKNQTLLYSLIGLRSQEEYQQAIDSFSRPSRAADAMGGVRIDLGRLPASQTADENGQPQTAEQR